MQTSIQVLIAVGSFELAALGLPPHRTSRDVLEQLESAGRIPAGSTARFGPIFAFRDRVVRPYDRIEPLVVYGILIEARQDLAELLDLLLAIRDDRPAETRRAAF